ncbi:MAG: hypothetical protein [Microviridae sp.]|nr:MAG: hypothetical protein [Microviridae sp.]
MYIRSPYDRVIVTQDAVGVSLTEQSHVANVDINNVVRKYQVSGDLAPPKHPSMYADVTAFQADLASRYRFAQETLDAAELARPGVVAARQKARDEASRAASEAKNKSKE